MRPCARNAPRTLSCPLPRHIHPNCLQGLTDYVAVSKGIVGKAAAAALRGAWGKGASAEVKQALTVAAAHVPAKEDNKYPAFPNL